MFLNSKLQVLKNQIDVLESLVDLRSYDDGFPWS